MNRLKQLYQEMILDHNRHPRNFKELEHATCKVHGKNPLCGDDYHLYVQIGDEGEILDLSFTGSGCAISKSSASIMTQVMKNKDTSEAKKIKNAFLSLLLDEETKGEDLSDQLTPQLKVFEGVKEFPVRVKCATLIWRALEKALENPDSNESITTE